MEALFTDLDLSFKRISNDLQFAAHQLETRLGSAALRSKDVPDVYKMVAQIRSLQKAVPELHQAFLRLSAEKEDAKAQLAEGLLANYKGLLSVYRRIGTEPDTEWVATAKSVSQLLVDSEVPDSGSAAAMAAAALGDTEAGGRGAGQDDDSATGSAHQAGLPMHIDAAAFAQLPASTRGKARLQDAQKVWRYMAATQQQHGQQDSKPQVVSKHELAEAGCRVTGHTGDAVLRTLKALGVLSVGAKGVAVAKHLCSSHGAGR